MKQKTLFQLHDYLRESFYTTNFQEQHTRQELEIVLNKLYPHMKLTYPLSQPFSDMCKGRAMKHIEFYIHLHNLICKKPVCTKE